MLQAIRFNLAHLGDFGGRQGRPSFWYWVAAVALFNVLATILISIPMAMSAVGAAMQVGKTGDQAAIEAAVAQGMSGQIGMVVWSSVAINAINAVLLSAAFVRRLHDTGLPGWIVIVPLACVAASSGLAIVHIPEMAAAMTQAIATQSADAAEAAKQSGGLESVLGWLPLLILIGFGIRKSQPESNRWGEPPAA